MFEIPSILDYPDAPLPAWKHYGITNYAGKLIQNELDRQNNKTNYLIGLGVSYGPEENIGLYAMEFGKADEPNGSDSNFPLSDEFVVDLYEMVNKFVHDNISIDKIGTKLITTFSGSIVGATTICRQVQNGECNHNPDHVGTNRKCISLDNGATWRCLGGNTC